MRLLFVGGTGLLSSACAQAAVDAGHELWLVTRGTPRPGVVPAPARHLLADARDPAALRAAVGSLTFDAVVQWVGFTPEHVAVDVEVFGEPGRCGQYVFVSSASVYEKPPGHYLVREGRTPLANPFWQYSRDKIACEELLAAAAAERAMPVTVVRPSLTYGPSQIPLCVNSWERPWTAVARMRAGAHVIVPGDGTSLWPLTHARDLAAGLLGLLGNPGALGRSVHVTTDKAPTWNQIYAAVQEAAGTQAPILHVPTDALVAADPGLRGTLWGDKVHSTVFDLTELRSLVPGFRPRVPLTDGLAESIAWFEADPSRQQVDGAMLALWDRVTAVYLRALHEVAARG